MPAQENIFPEFSRMQTRADKEAQLRQRSRLFWFYGLSGSGKSTLARALEDKLTRAGHVVKLLDGDNLRTGLNGDLGFSESDRRENIRRVAEVSKLFVDAGIIVLASFITPLREFREAVRTVNDPSATDLVYVKCSFETCAARDVKGLYAKAASGKVGQFTGKDSSFEEPAPEEDDWIVSTEGSTPDETAEALFQRILPLISAK